MNAWALAWSSQYAVYSEVLAICNWKNLGTWLQDGSPRNQISEPSIISNFRPSSPVPLAEH